MKRQVRKLGRRISAEKVSDPHGIPQGFVPNHHKTTASAGGANPMLVHHSAPTASLTPQRSKSSKKVVRRSSDTAIVQWDDLEAKRMALESLKQIGPTSSGRNGTGGGGAEGGQPTRTDARGLNHKRTVRRSTVGDMDDGYPTIAEAVPPARTDRSLAVQEAPVTVVSARRKPNMRRGSTEGIIDLEAQRRGRRDSFLFDLSDSAGTQPRADSPLQGYDSLRSHDDVDADLDLAAERLPAGAFTGSREVSEIDLEAAAQLAGSKSAPAAGGAAGEQGMQMRSAVEVKQAVSRARERMPSDEWSEEARRTTHEVLVTFDAIAKPDTGGDSDGLTVWQMPTELPSGISGDSGESSGGALESYNPQRLALDTVDDDPTRPRQHSKSPSVSPRVRGAGTPGGRSRQKTVWSDKMMSSADEEHQQDWSDTDSDHDSEEGAGPSGGHRHHRLRNKSGNADDDGAHRIGGSNEFYRAQRVGGGGSNDGTDDSMQLRNLIPAGDRTADGNGTSSPDLDATNLVTASGAASGSDGDQPASSWNTVAADGSDLGRIDVTVTTAAPGSEPATTVDSGFRIQGGSSSLVANASTSENEDPAQQMLRMMSERCTKVQQEKHQLEERVAQLEAEKKEWEALKARLISTLTDDGEN